MNRVAELTAPREFTLVEQELPDPGPGEVQVRVAAIGICGSDMHSYAEGAIGDVACRYPMVLGHEPSGVVLKTGAGVTGWDPGDEAALEPAIYCYHCEFCMSGRHNVCSHLRFLSSIEDPGFFRDRVNLPMHNLVRLGCGVGLREGTLIEPLAVALHSLEHSKPALGDRVVVIGAGPIGLLTIAAIRLAGVTRIWAIEPLPHRREMALAMGADAALPVDEAVSEILRDTGRRGVDAVFDCAAKPGTVEMAIQLARPVSRVVLTGIHSEVDVPFPVHAMRRKEIALFTVRRSNHESELARDLLSTHARLFAPLITHERPLEHINAAFEMLDTYADNAGKVVIRPS
jgi:L-iditol 2-dehydrogenase